MHSCRELTNLNSVDVDYPLKRWHILYKSRDQMGFFNLKSS